MTDPESAIDPAHPPSRSARMAPTTRSPSRRKEWSVAIATALVASAAYTQWRIPLSNIDDYNVRPYAAGYWNALAGSVAVDTAVNGRFRPAYWVVEGLLGVVTGSSGTVLHAGRLCFLAAAVAIQVLLAVRVGAGAILGALLALATAWSVPALASWIPGGPGEALAQPLALACVLLVLRATSWRGIAVAAALGLAACLTKETYAASTAGTLAAGAIAGLARGERRMAVAGAAAAAIQFAPAAIAFALVRAFSGSYLEHVVSTLVLPAASAARTVVALNPLAVAAGVAGVAAIALRLRRTRPARWPVEDVVVLGVLSATFVETVVLGFAIPRYHLPLNAALALAAARGAVGLFTPRRIVAVCAVGALLAIGVAAGGARAALAARASAADLRTDERMREQIGSALAADGRVRIFWVPEDVERPMGAVAHLAADGIRGDVEMRPCTPLQPESAKLLGGYFARYEKGVGRAQVIASTSCPGTFAPALERVCTLTLPGVEARRAQYDCFPLPEKFVVVGRW